MYGVYHVDVGRCMSDKQEFRNQMQGTHVASFPENLAVAECIMGIQQHLQNG